MKKQAKSRLYTTSILVDKMRNTAVNLKTIQRLLRPNFKTTLLGGILTLKLKDSNFRVKIITQEVCPNSVMFSVYANKHNGVEFYIHAKTSKELLTKILYKYEFFQS